MPSVNFRFYEELNDFLPPDRRKQEFMVPYRSQNSIKDMIESAGVPHTEVDLILVNGASVGFDYIVQPDDRISVYPVFESLDVSGVTRLRPEPLRRTRFVVDTNLGKLARYLRLLGFDTLFDKSLDDAALADVSAAGGKRILLTRDQGLLKRKQVTHGYFVRNDIPLKQIREVLQRCDLYEAAKPFTRCMQCNGEIEAVDKEEVIDRLPPRVAKVFDEFSRCPDCQRVYWKGSHYERMERIVRGLLGEG